MKISKAFKKIPIGARASIAFFISTLVTKGISYITTPIYTRLLSTTEYGQVSVFLTWVQVFGIIAMFCLSYGVFNNGMVDYPNERNDYSFSMLILSNIITLAFSGILLCVYPLVKEIIKMDMPLIIVMCVLFLFQPAYNFWRSRQRYEMKYKAVLFWSILSAVVSPLVAILLIVFNKSGSNLYARIFGAECPLIAIYIGFYVFLGAKNRWRVNVRYWKEALLFNLPLIPHYLSAYLLSSSDKIMISFLVDDSSAAFYSVAHAIASIAIIIWTSINASLVPYTYEKCKEEKLEDINKVTLPLITLFAVGCFVVILLAPEAVSIMATKDYTEAIYVIPPIVGGVFFQVQYYIYANIVYYYKKPKYVLIGSLTAVVLNIVLNYFCIKMWGYMAAGYTTIICYGLQATIDYFAMRKIVGKQVYNMKYIFALSAFVTLFALFSNLLYDYPNARFAILILVFVFAFLSRDKIVKILKFNK